MTNDTPKPKKRRSLTRTTEQILKVVTAQQMSVAGVEVDLNRHLVAIRIAPTTIPMNNEAQEADETLAAWEAQHSPPRHP